MEVCHLKVLVGLEAIHQGLGQVILLGLVGHYRQGFLLEEAA
jgi:hypothetical protein